MKFEFTDSQKKALAIGEYSLIVAAGAGSGKTRVLIERVVRRLLQVTGGSSTDITRFLIVTFTNAAAGELCERIRKALADAVENAPDEAVRSAAVKNLALLPQAKICTIDSFCYDFVREHAELLGLPSKLRIADDTEMDVLLDGIIDELIEEKMALCRRNRENGKDGYFLTAYDMFSAPRNDDAFVDTLKKLYKDLLHRPSPRDFLAQACELYREVMQADELFDTTYGRAFHDALYQSVSTAITVCENALDECEADEQMHKTITPVLENDLETLKIIASSLGAGYRAAKEAADTRFKPSPRIQKIENPDAPLLVARRKSALDEVKAVSKRYFSASSELVQLCAADCLHIAEVLREMLEEIENRLWDVKRTHGILSFSDVERLTLKLLYDDDAAQTPSALAAETSNLFDELYIDEYQDVDPIQDKIFLALSRKTADGTECGRFLVGDAKQSIYRFRGATPGIFMHYRDTFAPCEKEGEARRRLFMSDNFRCAQSVIDFTNAVFEKVFDDYNEQERLTCSRADKDALNEPVHILLCNTDALADKTSESRRAAEAAVLYREIVALLNDPDACDSTGRHYTLADIAILTSKWDAAKQLERFFAARGMAVVCEKGENFFDRREIRLALSVLAATDNPQKDIPLAGVMRSPIGGFTDDELVQIRLPAKDKSLYEALCLAAQTETMPDEASDAEQGIQAGAVLTDKCQAFLSLLEKLRALSRGCGASEFLRKMYALTDLPAICAAGDESMFGRLSPEARKKNLMLLYDKARAFDSTVFRGIGAFLDYMNDIRSGEGLKSCSDTFGGIHIMSIHRSKGLEFPVCFLFNADRAPSSSENAFLMSDTYGLAFRLKGYADIRSVAGNDGFVTATTPFRTVLEAEDDLGEANEYKRLLYVALTRARDRLYITASPKPVKPKNGDESTFAAPILNALDDPENAAHGKSFLDRMFGFLATQKPFETLAAGCDGEVTVPFADAAGRTFVEVRTVVCTEDAETPAMLPDAALENAAPTGQTPTYAPDETLLEKIRTSIASRSARLKALCAVPPKLTVSLLKNGLIDYEDASLAALGERQKREIPDFVHETAETSAAERGTAMHVFMQFADFAACETHGAKIEAERLVSDGFLTETQRDLLDFGKLNGFFKTALYEKIRSAEQVYRELRFNLKVAAGDVLADAPETDDFVLVQGVIDCFIREKDGSYTVIDFKTDHVKPGEEHVLADRYANQLAFYCRAVADMTKAPVKNAVIFSFALMEEIPLDHHVCDGGIYEQNA